MLVLRCMVGRVRFGMMDVRLLRVMFRWGSGLVRGLLMCLIMDALCELRWLRRRLFCFIVRCCYVCMLLYVADVIGSMRTLLSNVGLR